MDNGEKRVLWMGVSPFEPDSEMASSLVKLLGLYNLIYPNNRNGMYDYDLIKDMLDICDVIATNQEVIKEDWEEFFNSNNWSKKLLQYKDGSWNEIKPGFSKENQK